MATWRVARWTRSGTSRSSSGCSSPRSPPVWRNKSALVESNAPQERGEPCTAADLIEFAAAHGSPRGPGFAFVGGAFERRHGASRITQRQCDKSDVREALPRSGPRTLELVERGFRRRAIAEDGVEHARRRSPRWHAKEQPLGQS